MDNAIAQYSTDELTFATGEVSLVGANVYISFVQGQKIVLEKTDEDCTITAEQITLPLSQADTGALSAGGLEIQIKAVFRDGTAPVSNWMQTEVIRTAKKGVLEYVER